MRKTFVFGTLLDADLRRIVLGCDVAVSSAVLVDHRVARDTTGAGPVLAPCDGGSAQGLVLDLDAEAAARLAFYTAGHGLVAERVKPRASDGPVPSTLYRGDGVAGGAEWSVSEWQDGAGPLARQVAEAVMASFRRVSPEELRFRLPMIRARADAALRAAARPVPAELRTGRQRGEVEVLEHRQPYCHYFAVGVTRLRHPLYDGGTSDVVERAGLHMTDAVTVLPYDPARDRVMVVEQFRYGPWLRGDPRPWVLEPVAGRVDPGEDAETTARREALEEAGLEIGALHRIGSYYPSPGGVSEYIESFVGLADLPDRSEGIGGLDAENEDIRTHAIPFERALELVRSGEADTAPLLLSILWLDAARNRGAFA